uniref:ATPase associated with various cellular activities AAA_5 n=1 Tax=uncultured marine group II/III euryarchaeote KM3_65_G10 TaxID=1456480 RepID=A0A075HJB9_9EURY|nr:ATPase associated with various cellular activities AAA_5 [uncultured marine group II/III euryarchaeote KM3_65_G10]
MDESPEEIPDELEAPDSGDEISSMPSTALAQYSTIFFSRLSEYRQRMDKIFLDGSGSPNYLAPAFLFMTAILLFFSIIFLVVTTVPTINTESSAEGLEPMEPVYPLGGGNLTIPASISGEPFNCELWDSGKYGDDRPTDTNDNGWADEDERYGCPLKSTLSITISLALINIIFLVIAFYLANHIPNKSIMNPVFIFWGTQFVIFVVHGKFDYIFANEATVGLVAILGLIVATSVPLFRTILGRGFSNPPGRVFYLVILAAAVLIAAVFHNYALGPYAFCVGEYIPNADESYVEDECELLGYSLIVAESLQFSLAEANVQLVAATLLLLAAGMWVQGNIRIRDLDEARFVTMIVSGLVLQYLILAFNILTSEDGSLSLGEEDTILTVMALGVAVVGIYSFYRKRRGEGRSVGIAYFGIFAAGIFALFALFIAPVALSGREFVWPANQGAQIRLVTALVVTLLGLWLSVKFTSVKMREFGAGLGSDVPDSFTPSPTGGTPGGEPGWKSVEDAMEYILEQAGDEYQIELSHTAEQSPDYEIVEKAMMSDADRSASIRQAIEVDYDSVSYERISEFYSTSRDTVDEVITQLKSGRNIMLYGEPGTGKTALSNLLLNEICGEIEQPNGDRIPNYSIVTANAEWSNFDVIGGISPDDKGGYYFKEGCVAEAAQFCERSIQERNRPHYLVIDEFNRANIDEAFGKLFTVFEYRDKQPLLTNKETGAAPFFMPPEFRVIGTMNTQDKNTLFNVGMALMRRFAFIEIDLPDRDDEYNRMPIFCYTKLKKHGSMGERPPDALEWGLGAKCPYFAQGKFDYYDKSGDIFKAYQKLMDFLEEQEAPTTRAVEEPLGVRTFRKLGPALIIDSMVTIVNSIEKAGWEKAVNKVILSNILPSLEGLERNEIRCLALKATQVFGTQAPVTQNLERIAESPGLSVFG